MTQKGNLFVFDIFSQQKKLIQAVSTRCLGDMTDFCEKTREKNRQKFLNLLGLDSKDLVTMKQVHSNQVAAVKKPDRGREILKIDGMATNEKNLILAVKTADCLSLVAFDPENLISGVAHAGWKGIAKGIGKNLIQKMERLGSKPEKILIGIGPHIGPCCYSVQEERAKRFLKTFGNLSGMVVKRRNSWHLKLSTPLIFQLINKGVLKKNIELAKICTACRNDEFFSFRKENDHGSVGEFLTVVAMK